MLNPWHSLSISPFYRNSFLRTMCSFIFHVSSPNTWMYLNNNQTYSHGWLLLRSFFFFKRQILLNQYSRKTLREGTIKSTRMPPICLRSFECNFIVPRLLSNLIWFNIKLHISALRLIFKIWLNNNIKLHIYVLRLIFVIKFNKDKIILENGFL
jgi:hypothetical protein